jgi:ribA/ribD-fused uncharacterized protein
MKRTQSFAYFNGPESVFSAWYPVQFHYHAMPFEDVIHFLNYSKAKLFGDELLAERILKAKDPKLCRELGRNVKRFNQEKWNKECDKFMRIGCREKFLQHNDLLTALFETGDRIIVEANPRDFYWGIGLTEDDPRALHPCLWFGKNRLGGLLTAVREWLMEGYDEGTLPRRASWAVEEMIRQATVQKVG